MTKEKELLHRELHYTLVNITKEKQKLFKDYNKVSQSYRNVMTFEDMMYGRIWGEKLHRLYEQADKLVGDIIK